MVRSESNTAPELVEKSSRGKIRINYMAAVEVTSEGGAVYRGNLRDIGIESLFVKNENTGKKLTQLIPGTRVRVALTVNQGDSCLTIGSQGKILRTDDDGIAIIFSEPLKWWPVFSVFPQNEQFLFDVVS